jgi:hypothetical protein
MFHFVLALLTGETELHRFGEILFVLSSKKFKAQCPVLSKF